MLNPHATELIFHTPVLANKMELLVNSTTLNAPYIHLSRVSFLELWRTFPNEVDLGIFNPYDSVSGERLRTLCHLFF